MRITTSRGRRAGVVALGAALALAAAGCGGGTDDGGSGGGGGSQNISFLTHWGPEQVTALKAAATAFQKKNPGITVTVRAVPFANLLTTLRTQGASPNGPTMAGIYDLWLPELVRDGLAAPAPADAAKDLTGAWPANLVEGVTKQGQPRGYPNEVDLYALNYNKKLFAEAGIAAPPKTWDELASAAAKLTKREGGKVTRQGFGVITSWAAGVVHPWLSLVNSNGGALVDGSTPKLDDPKVQAATELYAKLVKDGVTQPSMSNANANTTGPYLDNFVNGKTGMIIMANWWQSALKEAMGDRYSDVGVAPVPVGPDGTASAPVSYSWLTMVNGKADKAKQDAAWKFLTFLNGPDSGKNGSSAMGDILVSMGILPSRTSDLSAHKADLSDPFLTAYVDQLPQAKPFPAVLGGEEMSQAVQKHIENVVFGKETAKDAMDAAQREVAGILSKAGA
ncbi:bicyclomycin resistance protein [Sphaerisporangium siamense]|uniref:Multiple sugar transport system substrate-binding protein n=1 Tax=Sphaerisporangium siamense TaxID=795645 RepID=A0A7W7DEW1_9ACTN|nr:ABC transporter substrate-binding protein [Sphaerisporangium siamense]MBB4704043.1 multiple sugar transport system substrate-binding protein [Sphaerisporangium siamense]GII82518.1 bicyclomycin resistance protein [Sphaerisporangium siamense]